MKLPLNRTFPKENESLYSFLHRLALVNHYDHFGSMFTEFESAAYSENCNELHDSLYWSSFAQSLVKGLGLHIEQLVINKYDEVFYQNNGEVGKGRQNYRRYYHRYSTKYCPDCLKEDFYHRLYWDLSYVTVCTKHEVTLITNCTKCKDHIRMSRLVRNECKCGEKYTRMKCSSPDKETLEMQKTYQALLFNKKKKIKRIDGKWLTKDEYFNFLYYFGRIIENLDINSFSLSKKYGVSGRLSIGQPKVELINLEKQNFILSTIYRLVTDPRSDMGNLVNSIDKIIEGKEYPSCTRRKKYKLLKTLIAFPKGEYYYAVYTDVVNSKTDEYIKQRYMLPPLKISGEYVGVGEATKLLKSEHTTLLNLCEHKLLNLQINYKDGKKIMLIERKSIDAYVKMKKESLTLNKATSYLGLNHNQMTQLLEYKIINPLHGPNHDGYDLWYITKQELDRFKKDLLKLCLSQNTVSDEGVSLREAVVMLRRERVKIGEIYQYIFNGRLRVFYNGNDRLIDGIQLIKRDIADLVRELYYKRIEEKGYLGKEIQRVCMAGQEMTRTLFEDKILSYDAIIEDGNNPAKKYVGKNRVIDYLKEYKALSEIQIKEHLDKIEKAFEPKV